MQVLWFNEVFVSSVAPTSVVVLSGWATGEDYSTNSGAAVCHLPYSAFEISPISYATL